jgi:hypothetical protein
MLYEMTATGPFKYHCSKLSMLAWGGLRGSTVIVAWSVLRLQMEEAASNIWRSAENILNNQSQQPTGNSPPH